MTDIKRYACEVYFDRGLYDHSDGLFVYYEDHAAIIAEKDARIAELETMFQKKVVQDGNKITALQEQVRALAAENDSLKKFCKNAAFYADYESELGMEQGGFTDGLNDIKTSATDTALREIRAQAVEEYAATVGAVKNGARYAASVRSGEQP